MSQLVRIALGAVSQVTSSSRPMRPGVAMWAFRGMKLDGLREVLGQWAKERGYRHTEPRTGQTGLFETRFYSLGFALWAVKRKKPSTELPGRMADAAVDVVAGSFSSTVQGLFEEESNLIDAVVIVVIRCGAYSQTALAMRTHACDHFRHAIPGCHIRVLKEAPVEGSPEATMQLVMITQEPN